MKVSLTFLVMAAISSNLAAAFAPGQIIQNRPSTIINTNTNTICLSAKRKNNAAAAAEYNTEISSCTQILTQAAITKCEDPVKVLTALENLEQLSRKKLRAEGTSASQNILDNLTGEWRLIFTTGTKKTQDRFNTKINYFPLKAIQKFDATQEPMYIENAIYVGDWEAIKFRGDFDFLLDRSKVEFEFDQIAIFGFNINLKKGQAAQIGASSGLGSESNVKNAEKGKKAFFNWISADENIATARGGGGGLALWQRVQQAD